MARATTSGKCESCGKEYGKAQITRHLAKCLSERQPTGKASAKRQSCETLHLLIEGFYQPDYWIHVDTPADTEFISLDQFLRDLWLECCGHLSAFKLPKPKETAGALRGKAWGEAFSNPFDLDAMFDEEQGIMDAKIGAAVKPGDVFSYEYDFGSTTKLKLKVVGKREGLLEPDEIRLLARNLPPEMRCECKKPAVLICTECGWDEEGPFGLCKACARKHPCGEEMLLPVVNSPRMGVCGYTG